MVCKWLSDEFSAICVNDESPACGDGCPCLNYYDICRYFKPCEDENEKERRCFVETLSAIGTLRKWGFEPKAFVVSPHLFEKMRNSFMVFQKQENIFGDNSVSTKMIYVYEGVPLELEQQTKKG